MAAVTGRSHRRVVSVGAVRGVLARRGGRWVVDNDSEVRLLEALRGEHGVRDRLWALAAALDAGVVEAAGLRRLNNRLSKITELDPDDLEELWRVRMPDDLRAAAAYVCVCVVDEALSRWLRFELAARLDSNLVRGLLPGPGWAAWHLRHRRRPATWDRDTFWIGELPKSFWSRLDAHSDAQLRAVAAASDPTARPKTLERLAEDRAALEVLDLVASNPNTPARVLRRLRHRSWGLPRFDLRVAQNHTASAGLLRELARSEDGEMRYVAAWHPKMPVSVLRRLAGDESELVRSAVAHAAAAPPEVLEVLAGDSDMWVRRNVARNPSTPPATLEALLGDRRAVVRAAAVANLRTPTELTATRVRDRAVRVRVEVVWRRGIAAGTLAVLAIDPKVAVRRAVARNPRTPPEILDRLAGDWDFAVRGWVAHNGSASPETLQRLAAGADGAHRWLRSGLAHNRATPVELLTELAADPEGFVRSSVADNPAAEPELLAALADDDDWLVRAGVASNPATPTDLLETLARDTDSGVRNCLCHNDKAPQRLVNVLRSDPDYWVRAAAVAACNRRRKRAA